jgi:hypothetical protein
MGQERTTMQSTTREHATARLGVAAREETSAARSLDAARGTTDELHAAVQLGAHEGEVAARTAWLAWVEEGDND